MPTTALTNVRVFNGEQLTTPRTVVLEDGLIADAEAASAADSTIDAGGGTLLPGLIDTHIHLHDREN